MRRWLALLFLFVALFLPVAARAQSPIKLSMLKVQLWPEYDQPSMLVIYDFKLPDGVKLPVSVAMSIPKEAHLMAVASLAPDRALVNTEFTGPVINEAWQVITIEIQTQTTYHLEYYQPLSRTGNQRQFNYVWPGDYAVDDMNISVRLPPDTTNITTNPDMQPGKGSDGSSILTKDFKGQSAGQQIPLQVMYTKTTNALSVPAANVEPSKPLSSSTPGRVFVWNYVVKYGPYILGAIGVIAIAIASIYLLQPHERRAGQRRQTHHPSTAARGKAEIYCHQCGARAEPGDRFCRVCGTKLRIE